MPKQPNFPTLRALLAWEQENGTASKPNRQMRRALRVWHVAERYAISIPCVWKWNRTLPEFPKGVKLSAQVTVWWSDELDAFDADARARTAATALRPAVASPATPADWSALPKRPRGRPRKYPLPQPLPPTSQGHSTEKDTAS